MSNKQPNLIIINSNIPVAPGVEIDEHRKRLVGVVLDLFQGKTSLYKLNNYFAEDAVYEDPVAKSVGRKEIAGQFYGLPELFKESRTKTVSIISNDSTSTSFSMTHILTPKLISTPIEFNTTMTITVNDKDLITHWQDRHRENIPDGGWAEWMRKKQSEVTAAVLPIPGNEEEDLGRWRRWYGDAVPSPATYENS
ncbi:hypothetical protein SAICODRAFT_6384 [Saitoella complicata NRRL Y-17804]|uniref:SnoaL-like domain-containing protein n=1 Tax=Saitoella complicata (strain BCRC 22490 / CBS 7301 / JCM 7358 / NBRC 10748 / NRRL Y-17804) TaxID=698492 RepID=A0A0E9NGZ9_SAICN|nr:uncharacterized protein SAICODRAFT_6384 [Saitoella complicata NRRL Y-17804]ODQ54090.1 hypothetical protein SAICODRAFT_6384 [Saitoella complicata NRRL Y-17804]GAO49162.1 hypothetical protein G7K_3320-t1 [Saitoella complicata NRRL Y-17804]